MFLSNIVKYNNLSNTCLRLNTDSYIVSLTLSE